MYRHAECKMTIVMTGLIRDGCKCNEEKKRKRKVGSVRYEAPSHGHSSPESSASHNAGGKGAVPPPSGVY